MAEKEEKNGKILDFVLKTAPPLGAVVMVAVTGHTRLTKLESDLKYLQRDHQEHHDKPAHDAAYDRFQANEEAIRVLQATVESLRTIVDRHLGLGHRDLPHPHGLILAIRELEQRIKVLEKND